MVYVGRAAESFYKEDGGGANNLCLPEQPESIMVSKHVFALFPGVGHVLLNILSFVLIIFCIMVSKLTVSWSGS